MPLLLLFLLIFVSEPSFAARKRKPPRKIATEQPAPPPAVAAPAEAPPADTPSEPPIASEPPPLPADSISSRRIGRRGWLLLPTLGATSYRYSETARADFRNLGVTLGLSLQSTSRRGIVGSGELETTLTTLSKTDARKPTGFARLALGLGKMFSEGELDAGVKAGFQARTMITEGNSYGYSSLTGLTLFLPVAYHFSSSSMVRAQFRFTPFFVSPFKLANRELGAELNFVTRIGRKTYLVTALGVSDLRFRLGLTDVSSNELFFRAGLAF